jgi:hypothetical protein
MRRTNTINRRLQNPHRVIASYAKDLEVVVFNGHVHTTELNFSPKWREEAG